VIVKTLAQGAKVLMLALVVLLAAYAGWRWRDAVFPRAEHIVGLEGASAPDRSAPDEVTPEAAEAAAARIRAFRTSDDAELRLASFEVSSLLRYSVPGMLPAGLVEPRVSMADDRVEIQVAVLPGSMQTLPDLGGILGILPDTVPVSVAGSLVPFGADGSMMVIHGITVQGVPIPPSAFPDILTALGREEVRGLPAAAIRVPTFSAIRGAYIENGELVLVRA
jgi:hypothetical protein